MYIFISIRYDTRTRTSTSGPLSRGIIDETVNILEERMPKANQLCRSRTVAHASPFRAQTSSETQDLQHKPIIRPVPKLRTSSTSQSSLSGSRFISPAIHLSTTSDNNHPRYGPPRNLFDQQQQQLMHTMVISRLMDACIVQCSIKNYSTSLSQSVIFFLTFWAVLSNESVQMQM